MKIKLIAGGTLKGSFFESIYKTYEKRVHRWKMDVVEPSERQWQDLKVLKGECWIALDQCGEGYSSEAFLKLLEHIMEHHGMPTFLIGPASGLKAPIKEQARYTMSFGAMTWPHLMARVMLIEQIYRAQQNRHNHPYSFI